MVDADLPEMESLLGDADVMRYYPAVKSRSEAQAWIDWNTRNYAEFGFGLWLVETIAGEFVGDCGLTMQTVDGVEQVEVGYHVRRDAQGVGYATEAALACLEFARARGISRVIAIINPANMESQRVALKCGLVLEKEVVKGRLQQLVFAASLVE
ncbi:GNAT family N-acetyltransferase [Subtercola sp. PAMC28395]|nr:GNAT family N-acetyltransferase [Subtercola sp. PAMC28395]